MDWFLYDRNLRHEKIKERDKSDDGLVNLNKKV